MRYELEASDSISKYRLRKPGNGSLVLQAWIWTCEIMEGGSDAASQGLEPVKYPFAFS